MLEWVVILFSRGSSWRRDQIPVSCIGRGMLYHRGTREEYRYPQRETDTQSTVKVSLHLPHTPNKLEDRDLRQGLSCTLATLHQRLWTWFFLSIPVFLFVLTHPTLRPLSSLTQWPNSLLGHGFPFSWCRMWSLNCVISWSWSTSKMTDSDILLNGHTVCSCLFLVRESHHHPPLTSGAVHTSALSPPQLTVPSFRSDVGAPQATFLTGPKLTCLCLAESRQDELTMLTVCPCTSQLMLLEEGSPARHTSIAVHPGPPTTQCSFCQQSHHASLIC